MLSKIFKRESRLSRWITRLPPPLLPPRTKERADARAELGKALNALLVLHHWMLTTTSEPSLFFSFPI